MRFTVKVEGATEVAGGLASVRRDLNRGVRLDLKAAAETYGLPVAKALSPSSRVAQTLRAGATSSSAYLEIPRRKGLFPGPKGGEVGRLFEFGGTRRDVIRARPGSALATPRGPRAAVNAPRRYREVAFLRRAVEKTLPQVTDAVGRSLRDRFASKGLDVS